MLIEVKAKVARTVDNKVRKKTETYLIDKDFFSEAEYKVTELLSEEKSSHLLEEFDIQSLRISSLKEIAIQYKSDNDATFVATLKDEWLEEDGTEKSLKYKVLLWAKNLTEANSRVHEIAKQGYEMHIESIKEVEYIYLTENE